MYAWNLVGMVGLLSKRCLVVAFFVCGLDLLDINSSKLIADKDILELINIDFHDIDEAATKTAH